jgi:amino acid adenylation domain-containing protein
VGLLLERSPEMVAAILAVLRAGGAYVPLDPGYPAERLRFMAADAGLALVVAQPGLETRLGADAPAPLASPAELEADAPAGAFPEMEPSPRSAAYVIYTSGSTGTPKGVVVEHHGLANQMEWIRQRFPLGADDVVLQKTPFHFDASVWEIFAPLLAGARLELAPQGSHADAAWLAEAVAARGVTVLQVVPTQLRLVLAGPGIAGWSGLRRLFSGGEPLTADLCDAVCRDLPGVELVNLYGPTETTVQVAYWEVGTAERGAAPIGRPVANARLYVLDGSMHPVPAGVRGELYVGGVGVGRGYLGRPELTAERFLPDPFGGEAGGRLYRTRDLASRRLDGALEYLGRADGQVKVRGFRVELGEVEAALMRHPSVRAAVVAVRADGRGEARLVGWWAPREGAAPASAAELREALLGELPPYMVPAALMQLAAFPLLPSGKTDRAALPEPEEAASAQAYEPPATAAEEALALVWAEVLGVECVGALDNFFAMGGDSIQSVRVVGMARDRGLRLSVQDVFEAQTVRELARKAGHGASEAEALEAILRRDRHPFDMVAEADRARLPDDATDAYPLAALQAGMLYHQGLSRDGAPPYHNINSYHFRGPFDEECFREAVRLSTARHENLRTSIHLGGFGEPLQVVHAHAEVPIRVTDLRHLDEDAQARELDAFRQAEFGDVLDLARAPLMRLHVHRRADDRFQLTLTECHAIADGWSTASLFADVFGDYAALLRGEPAPEREQPAVRFRDFVELERSLSEGEAGRRFWAERLDGFVPGRLPRLPEAFRDPSRTGTWNGHIPLALEKRAALQELARSLAVPLKSVLLAAHLKVLSLLTGERDVVTGFPANGRPEVTGGTDVRGLFLNNVPLRVVLRDQSWQELVRQVFREEMDILPHRRYPLALLQREHGPDRLFDASFNLVRFHSFSSVVQEGVVQVLGNTDLADTSHTLLAGASLHPVTAEIRGLPVQLQASEFSPEQMEAVPGYYLRVLEAMLADPAARHDSLQVLAPEEVERLLAAGSGGAPARAAGACLHESFAERARLAPDAVAVTSDGGSLTYGELDGWSNRLANHLRGRGVGPETRVGICMDRSLELVAAVLGVLKAGGAYVPLDPDYPAERLAFLLEDSGAALVLTRDDVTGRLPDTVPALSVDAERDRIAREDPAAPDVEVDPENLAYVIYTSGSTGRPKGVQVTHANVARLFTSTREWFGFGEDDVWTLFHSYAFDFSVWEIWGALLHGGRLVVVPHLVSRAPDAFHRLLVAEGVTVLSQTPSAFRQLAAADEVSGESSGLALRWVVFGGEALDPVSLKPWMERHGDGSPRLVNMYGITETTVHVTYRPVTLADAGAGHASPVGVPIPDLRVRLLDAGGSPVPVGVPGELYVGGAGVARGYLGRPGLTAERFLPDPFSAEPGARLYRSGDRARWLPSGEPEFLGRIDAQVKIRGFRVEPGEVEAVLSSHPAVREAAVVVRGGGAGAALVGYASLRAGEEDAAAGLRGWLRERLPEHMVPAAVVVLDALPLTPHGKTDRRALPAPTASDLAPGTPRVLPETEMEARIAGVWAEVLQLESVGVEDNFFDLGGHSILLVQLQGRISAAVEREVSLVDLLEHPTVRAQAASLAGTDTGSSTDEGEERGEARQAAASRRAEARRRRGR